MTRAYSRRSLNVFASSPACAPRRERIAEQRLGSGAVDQYVSGLEHLHRVMRSDDRGGALNRSCRARVDEITKGMLDVVERTEAAGPFPQQIHQIRWNRLPKREAFREL